MSLKKLYDHFDIPESERIKLEKNVLLVLPDKDFDVSPYLDKMGLSKWEVAATWPKDGLPIIKEIKHAKPKVVVQIEEAHSKKYLTVSSPGDVDSDLLEKIHSDDVLADKFVNLHHHDEYSVKDGLGTVHDLIDLLKRQRRSFCCVTNHGSVGGWIKQYTSCKEAGVKAIFGMEAYQREYRGDDPELKKKHRKARHLILIAKTHEGFYNLIKIHNDAQLNGFYYVPASNREAMKKWGKGIIATSACIGGIVSSLLMAGKKETAAKWAKFYQKCFDEFYLELSMIEYPEQIEANRRLIELSRETGIPTVVAGDSHYLEPEHGETHDLIMLINQHKTIHDKIENPDEVWQFDVHNLFYRDSMGVLDLWENGFEYRGEKYCYKDDVFTEEVLRESMANTRAIGVKCEDIELDSSIKLPTLYPDSEKILRDKVKDGFRRRGLKGKEYVDRAKFELKIIGDLGWNDYFLILDKIVIDAKEKFGEWAIGYGRGSAAGSLVSYCLGLTDIDPIRRGLLFERFLDYSRPDPPDIDMDFDPRIRDWVKDHVKQSFGEEHVCSIGTYQTYKTKAVILDVARALGYDIHEANQVTKNLLGKFFVDDDDGEEEEQGVDSMSWEEIQSHYEELRQYFDRHPDVLQHVRVIRNQNKNLGTHAGGVIISQMDLNNRIPVYRDKKGNVVSAWVEGQGTQELSKVGLVKFDLLGLKNLQVVGDCVRFIEETTGKKLGRNDIPIDDKKTIRLGSKGDLVGIFQLENPDTKPIADMVELESLEDVTALTSLIRPGPKDNDMHLEYAERKHGKEYDMPEFMREKLALTHGVITYQEQAMKISQVLSGFTDIQACTLRKAIGKKIPELMAKVRQEFIDGAVEHRVSTGEITKDEVIHIWDMIETFAGYAFNKSHAIAYSALSCAELWLKYHYPVEYMTALINNTKQGDKKSFSKAPLMVGYINYCRRRGIKVLPPDINKSRAEFSTDGSSVRYGLGRVKRVASAAGDIAAIQPVESVEDFYERVNRRRVNKRVVESLIASGAFLEFGSRNEVLAEYHRLRKNKKDEQKELTDDQWHALEVDALGVCLSRPPIVDQYADEIKENRWCRIGDCDKRGKTKVFGRIVSVTPKTSKKGNHMYIVNITDDVDSIDFFVFERGMMRFNKNVKKGYTVAIPLDKFEDSSTRFYDSSKDTVIVKR